MASPISPFDPFNFESNKIIGPPNGSTRPDHVKSKSLMGPTEGIRSSFPQRQLLSLKILSPLSKSKNKKSNTFHNPSFDDMATPKTRGIKLLKKTSSQYMNQEFTKRLSIPSFHVADQILMDILTEQNQNNCNGGMNMNIIQEDEIHDDDDDISILEFIEEEDDDDYFDDDDDDTDLDSLMTLDAFPDLPDFALKDNHNDNDHELGDEETPISTDTMIVNTPSHSVYTPQVTDHDEDDESFEDEDEDDDDEVLTPTTYNKLFKSFHHAQDEDEDEDEDHKDHYEETKHHKDMYPNIAPKYSFSTKQMKINISQFKSHHDEEQEWAQDLPRGFSFLQRSASFKLHENNDNVNDMRRSKSYSVESETIINTEKVQPYLSSPLEQKATAAERAILVAKELLETEIQYQTHLKNMQRILLAPIISTYFGNDCVSSIFYKFLCDIVSVSKSFTLRLSIYVKAFQIPQLANWIYFSCKRFGVYAHYAKMYDIFLDRLSLCKDLDDNVEFWIKRQEKVCKKQLKNQKLHSLLMMPIQRLPRYILLLEELIKYTQRIDANEYGNDVGTILFLELAKSEIQTVSQRVNEMVRQRENRSNLRELINRFCGENKSQLLRNNRVLVYEGFLYKVRKYKIKYYFHLFSDIITYSSIANNGLFNIHRIIDLHKVAIIDLPNVDEKEKHKNKHKNKNKNKKNYKEKIWYRFLLKSKEKSFEILTENEQEKQNWLLLLTAAIARLNKNNIEARSSPITPQSMSKDDRNINGTIRHSIDNVKSDDDEELYAPYWVPDDASNHCWCCNVEFTRMNRRHHCRRCGNLVCKQCSKNKKLLLNIDKKKKVKICDVCFAEKTLNNDRMPFSNIHRLSNVSVTGGGALLEDVVDDATPKEILTFTRAYKHKLRVLLEHFCRPIMDVVENNKIITDFITSNKFYNTSNIVINKKKTEMKDQNKELKQKKNKKKELRKKKRKKALEKTKKNTLTSTDIKAKNILNNLYKFKCCHKTLISLCVIVEQIYDIICLLHSDLKLIIFKKHINYEDDMILDLYQDNDKQLKDADHARIGRLFIMYTDLFNIHIEYATRFPECYHILIADGDKTENHLIDFMKDVKLSLISLNKSFVLKDLLQSPLDFTRHIYQYLKKIDKQINSAMVNSSDLNLCIKTLKQIIIDLDTERTAAQQRIKLYKLESHFDFNVDFREKGRTLIEQDYIIKTTKHLNINHNYYFHLFSNILCYSAKKLGNSKFVMKNYIYLSNIVIIIDGMVYDKEGKKKKNKKRDLKTLTLKYTPYFVLHNDKDKHSFNVISEEDEEEEKEKTTSTSTSYEIKTFSLIFESKGKKQHWFELMNRLVEKEKAKYINTAEEKNNNRQRARHNHIRSRSLNSVRKHSANGIITFGAAQFCGICHASFNRLYNIAYKCIRCEFSICDACCSDNFCITKTVIAPKYLKLCVRCNYHDQNERSCNILCI